MSPSQSPRPKNLPDVPDWVRAYSKHYQTVFEFLADSRRMGQKYTVVQIHEALEEKGVSKRTVARAVEKFAEEGALSRTVLKGGIYQYEFRPFPKHMLGTGSLRYSALTPNTAYQLLLKFASDEWIPKFLGNYKVFPRSIARMYELAYEAATGSIITQEQVDEVIQDLKPFRESLESVLSVLYSVLATEDLHDNALLPPYLISGVDNPAQLPDKIKSLREQN